MANLIGSVNSKISTNDYVSALKLGLSSIKYWNFVVHLKEDNTNAIKFKILASIDQVTWETIKAETTLAKDGSVYETLSDAWLYIDVQFKANVADTQGKLTVNVSGS